MSNDLQDGARAARPTDQASRVLEMMSSLPPFYELGPQQARELQEAASRWQERAPVFEVEDLAAAGPASEIPMRSYRPSPKSGLPVCMFFHGGGWLTGSIETHDALCRELANAAGFTVLSVEYRLAPENPFPAGLEDCYAATLWLSQNLRRFDAAPWLAVAGDSAGANLAAAVAILARDRSGPDIAAQLLLYPVADPAIDSPSFDLYDGWVVSRRAMRWYWSNYLPRAKDRQNPLAALRHATDLAGLPTALVLTAECDPLRDEGEDYAARLHDAGVNAHLLRYDGMIHDFVRMFNLIDGGREAILDAAHFLRQAATGETND